MLSLQLPSDHNDKHQHQNFQDDGRNRALDAETHIVEEAVRRRRRVEPEDFPRLSSGFHPAAGFPQPSFDL